MGMHVSEWRLFPEGTVPEFTRPEWYAGRERAPHLEQPDHGPWLRMTHHFARLMMTGSNLTSMVDLGCGDGGLLSLMKDTRCWGYDLCQANVEAARDERGVTAVMLDVAGEPESITWGELAVATEMLEHLADPHGFVRLIASRARAVVASSPVNEDDRSHYEFHAWAWDMAGYRAMFEAAGFGIVIHSLSGSYQILAGVGPPRTIVREAA
jgi:trans-aconitate methyltransferase